MCPLPPPPHSQNKNSSNLEELYDRSWRGWGVLEHPQRPLVARLHSYNQQLGITFNGRDGEG